MKKLVSMALLIMLTFNINAQKIIRDSDGNYHTAPKVKDTVILTTKTNNIYTDRDGNVYPVYESARGARFIMKKKKDGTYYKMYMPKQ